MKNKFFKGLALAAMAAVFSATASAAGFSKPNTYKDGQFSDVSNDKWFASSVASSYELGFMNGTDDTVFSPNGDVTVAQAITIASRVNDAYHSKGTSFDQSGKNWYDCYVDYAIANGIITDGQFDSYTRNITRSEMAVVFSKAVPTDFLEPKNDINEIPDIPSTNAYFDEVLSLYKAGVVMGSDEFGTFKPNNNITRAEAAAIINRVALPESRLRVYTAAELEKMTIYFDANAIANFSLANCLETKPVLRDGAAYATPKPIEGKKPDPILNCPAVIPEGGLDSKLYKTIEVGVKYGNDVAAGSSSSIFFTTAALSWSEKGRVTATYDGKKDANGVSVIKFNMAANENWKDMITNFRFDPYDNSPEFGVAYIKLVPTID